MTFLRNTLLIGMLLLHFFSCDVFKERKDITISDRIVSEYLQEMEKKYDLHCIGNGGGFLDKVNEVIIYFTTTGPKNIEKVRELLVLMTEDLLRRYNENEEIRPFLKNYPFTSKNLSMGITLKNQEGREITNPGNSVELLWGAFQNNGIISFVIENEAHPYLQNVFEETYEEAFSIVRNQKLDLFAE